MFAAPQATPAHVDVREAAETLQVELSGTWDVTAPRPAWLSMVGKRLPKRVRLTAERVESWDSALLLFVLEVRRWCEAQGVAVDEGALPPNLRGLLQQLAAVEINRPEVPRSPGLVTAVGLQTTKRWRGTEEAIRFVGEIVLGVGGIMKHIHRFRWRDAWLEMQQCGVQALPIVGLINFLVGITLAYTGAIVLRLYGGDIYVADLVGLSMVREMGPVMTAIVMAGRTGAAFAAQIANMKGNEEIDALTTLGLRPVEFLVLPRVLALGVMMPLLVFYSNTLGILGGMVIAKGVLSISPTAYLVEMQTIVDMSDLTTGLIKAATFGIIVGVSGCLRGLQAERDAAGVGQAATSAVVTSILWIIVADAIGAMVFNTLNW